MTRAKSADYEIKRAETSVSATAAGVFEGYASLFDVTDGAGDVVAPGAFAKTLAKRGSRGVKMLWQHKAAEPLGVWTTIIEDARGLRVVGRLDLSVARAREALSLMREGALDGLSIGFRAVRAEKQKNGLRRLIEIDLWEISLVTFPMLEQARISAVKSTQRSPQAFAMLLRRLQAARAAARIEAGLSRLAIERSQV